MEFAKVNFFNKLNANSNDDLDRPKENIVATAWHSPNRDIILSINMILPILMAIGFYFYIRHCWQKQPILYQSMLQIESYWQVFRHGFDTAADVSVDISNDAPQ
jgi:hypothetical protein